MEAKTFSSMTDVIDHYVTPSLGEFVDDYDFDAIADEITEWRDGKLVIVKEDEFWEIAAKHDISGK